MQTIRFQCENYVARTNLPVVDDIAAVDNTNDAAGEIVFPLAINSGHLCCFTADQGATRRAAGARKTPEQFFEHAGFEFSAANVIHEKKLTCAQDFHFVYSMVNK